MRVGYYQFDVKFAEVDANLAKVTEALSRVEADLIVLPELFATGYFFASRDEVERVAEAYPDGKTVRCLAKIARERKMTIVAGFAEKAGGELYNSAAVLSPDGPAARYRKAHLFDEEKLFFSRGDTPLPRRGRGVRQDRRHDLLRLALPGGRPHAGPAGSPRSSAIRPTS